MADPLVLPDPVDERLERSPLRLVVCQVRHNRSVAVSDAGRFVEAQSRLADQYPEASPFEPVEFVLTAGPRGANANTTQAQQGWQLKSDDGRWTVTFQSEFFSIETSAYEVWADFRERFTEVLQVVCDLYEPKLEQRIGLRYVNELVREDFDSPRDWIGFIDPALLGPIGDDSLGPAVRLTQQLVEYEGPERTRVLLRHGCEPLPEGGGTLYRMDHDCFYQRARAFEASAVLATLDSLHTLVLQVFQKGLTPKLYAELRGPEAAES